MSDDKGIKSVTEFRVGYDDIRDPKVMIINIPLQFVADNPEFGTALLRGKLEEAKQIALNLVSNKRIKKQQETGLIKPQLKVN